jgi:hypothetical protein
MSQYQKTPFKASPVLAVAGIPTYLMGSWNDRTGPTLGYVISDASNGTTTGTLIFQIQSGSAPIVGALITVVGTANGGGNFNVTNASILTVVTTVAGVCTVTYAISSTSTPTVQTADNGQVQVPQSEVGDTITSFPYASVPVARPFNNPETQSGQAITATLNLGAGLSAVVATLQGADIDLDSEYTTIHTFGTSGLSTFQSGQDNIAPSATPGAIESNPGGAPVLTYRFYRFNLVSGTGTGTAIGKIEF